MRLASLWSGGKDSAFATYLALKQGHEIKALVTIFPEKEDSWMFHYPCVELTKLQAKAMPIKQVVKKTKGEKEKELEDLKKVLSEMKKIDGIVSGAIASNYQKSRIDKICNELGIKHISPLWQKNQEKVLQEEIHSGFEIIITGVFAEGFDKSWIGRKIDDETIKELLELKRKFGISVSGEGGEYESFVKYCPLFKKRIEILNSEIHWDSKTSSGYLIPKKARLV
jgi:ABC transporter with metal-binding/Fe-S-binding domain ATP-binding protein